MLPQIICLGAVNVDLVYRVADLAGLLRQWGTGLAQGGEEALSREGEARLQALLADYGRFEGLVGGGQAYILLDPAGERTILVAPHTNDDLKESDLPREELAGARFLHLTSFAGDGPLEVQRELAGRLANGPRLTLDPGELYARRGRGALTELLDHVETLLLTEEEWARLGGEAKRHPDWAPPIVVVKRGAEGARMLTPVRYLDFPPEGPGFLVDTLGAGDVFAAGYLAGLFIGLNLPQAIRLAVKAAAYKLTGAARDRYPDREVLNRMIAQLR
jgi:sugar/nucleoside kinase (ribokinase family)